MHISVSPLQVRLVVFVVLVPVDPLQVLRAQVPGLPRAIPNPPLEHGLGAGEAGGGGGGGRGGLLGRRRHLEFAKENTKKVSSFLGLPYFSKLKKVKALEGLYSEASREQQHFYWIVVNMPGGYSHRFQLYSFHTTKQVLLFLLNPFQMAFSANSGEGES